MSLDFSHGGDILGAREHFGIHEKDFLDFSSNINSIGYPEILNDIIAQSISSISKYPDNMCRKLRLAISSYIGVSFENIIPGNGAMELLRVVMEMPQIKRVLIIGPTFVEYEKLAILNGKEYIYHELFEEENFDFLPITTFEKLQNVDAVFICNPNNPTSKLYSKSVMDNFLKKCNEYGILTIIDETFIELTIEGNKNSLATEIKNFNNLIVIRAVTKYFAMPGIRLGYAIVSDKYTEYFWEKKATWSVNTFAAELGEIFLTEELYRKKTLDWMEVEVEYLYQQLCNLEIFKVYKPSSIFVLLKILKEDINSDKLFELLGKRSILIRNAKNFKFLDNSFIRIAIKDRNSNNYLISALRDILILK